MANHQSDTYGPTYYKRGKTQVWDFIRDNNLNFHLGNAIKYIARAGYKDSKEDDLIKAIHYLENELQHTQSTSTSEGVSEVLPYPQFKDSISTLGPKGSHRGGVQGIFRI
tara:strand:- start:963 stop:1292 length:330 start_codon:yes stop_codon:yes gene_type:complete